MRVVSVFGRVGAGDRSRWTRLAAPLLLLVALSACAELLPDLSTGLARDKSSIPVIEPTPAQERMVALDPPKSTPPIMAEGQQRETAAIDSAPKPAPPLVSRPKSTREPVQTRRAPARPAKPVFDPDQLLGLGRAQVVAMLGMPDLLRRDPPAQLWLYEGKACTAHLFLYQSSPDSAYEVRHFETQQAATASACFASLVARRSSGGSGGQVGQLR